MKLPPPLFKLCEILIDAGARPVIVGGYVRDFFMQKESKDIDIEIFDIDSLDKLKSSLQTLAPVHEVGKHFGVLKIRLQEFDFDISLPRKESKTGKGHKGFAVKTDGFLSFTEAASRRDFCMNAIGYDVKAASFLDPFGGREDIAEGIIRHIKDESFIEDPLRVLRAVQFAARFNYKLHPNTLKLCQNMVKEHLLDELPKERIYEEYKKLLLKAEKPSLGFELLNEMGALYPELKAIQNVPQDKIHHPEGDVWIHTMMSLDAMSELKTGDEKRDLILLLAALCHDLGKAEATEIIDGKVRAIGHENILEPAINLIQRLSDEKALLESILPLIKEHLIPSQLYKQNSGDAAVRRLSTRVNINNLLILARADNLGRTTETAKNKEYPAGDWLMKKAKELDVFKQKPKALLQGRHLIARGMEPGVGFKKILDEAYEAQLEGKIDDEQSALNWLDSKE